MKIESTNFTSLFLNNKILIDLRAPIEFQSGSIPTALNLPLLTDEERHQVGITYKEQGQSEAIVLGHKIVSGAIKAERVQKWIETIQISPDKSVLFCFRGGLRSQTVQIWLQEEGYNCPIVSGGYKALRTYLMKQILELTEKINFEVVCGPTGSGKTNYLKNSSTAYLDLEFLAQHRGSAFGAFENQPQPTQINFENKLAVELIKLSQNNQVVLIENESRMIGRRAIPDILFQKIQSSPKIILKVPLEVRIENIFKDYILNSSLGQKGDKNKFSEFRNSVQSISRKLGGLRTQEILQNLSESEKQFEADQNLDSNRIWIEKLLVWYYDSLYKIK